MRALFALIGGLVAVGGLLLVAGLRGRVPRPRAVTVDGGASRRWAVSGLRAAVVLTIMVLVGVATRWPVAALLAGVACWTLPAVIGPDRAQRQALARLGGIAAWAEDLAGTLRSAGGIEQSILTTADAAPESIRPELERLAHALRSGVRLRDALWDLAEELADPTAEMVVNILLQAATHEAADVASALSDMGRRARRKASARLRIGVGRARTRTAVRIIVIVELGSAVLFVAFAGDLVAAYGTVVGQLVLAVLGAAFAGAFAWMLRTGRVADVPRILTRRPEATS
jgi:hypothetical protein